MICPKCNKKVNITDESRFCPYCGFHFKVLPKENEYATGDNDDPQQVMKKIGEQIDAERQSGAAIVYIFAVLFIGIPAFLIFKAIMYVIQLIM